MSKKEEYQKELDALPDESGLLDKILDADEAQELYPEMERFSWVATAMNIWHWIVTTYDVGNMFMPPIKVDTRKNPPTTVHKNVQATMAIYYNWFNEGDRYDLIMPTQYECHIYQKNFERFIWKQYKNQIPYLVIAVHMTHTLMHEFVHYITSHDFFSDLYEKDSDWHALTKEMKQFIDQLNTFEDEKKTEKEAIIMTYSFLLEMYEQWNLSESIKTLRPVIGGAYDLRLREKSDEWKLIASTLELLISEYIRDFVETSDGEDIVRAVRYDQIVKEQREYAKAHNKKKWVIIS